jgi:hypothetical protein
VIDAFVLGMCDKPSLYQSSESKALVRDLQATTLEEKAFQPLMTNLASLFTNTYAEQGGASEDNLNIFCKTLTMKCIFYYFHFLDNEEKLSSKNDFFKDLTEDQKKVFLTNDSSGPGLKAKQYLVPENVSESYRKKKLEAISNYLRNPDNNGKKLMQYMQVNSSGKLKEDTLTTKSTLEIERLEKIGTSSSMKKAKSIKAAMSMEGALLKNKRLRQSLMMHRGFFKNMPDSYTNVFCKDNLSASHSQM